jgi:hypothetical protein
VWDLREHLEVNRRSIITCCVLVSLVALGVTARVLLRDVPNFAPIAALALFAGYYFRQWWVAVSIPLSVMILSDLMIDAGGYPWPLMLTVYGLLALPVCLGVPLRRNLSLDLSARSRLGVCGSLGGLFGCSLACSVVFFVGTNWMVWMMGGWYEPTWAGLAHCFTRALPFFRYTLAGDAIFAVLFFGGYALVSAMGHEIQKVTTIEPVSAWDAASP